MLNAGFINLVLKPEQLTHSLHFRFCNFVLPCARLHSSMSKTGISVHFPSPNLPTSSDKCNRLEGCLRDSDCKPSAALLPSRASGTPSKEQFRSDTIDTWQPFPLDMLVSLRRNIMDPEMNRLSRTILCAFPLFCSDA